MINSTCCVREFKHGRFNLRQIYMVTLVAPCSISFLAWPITWEWFAYSILDWLAKAHDITIPKAVTVSVYSVLIENQKLNCIVKHCFAFSTSPSYKPVNVVQEPCIACQHFLFIQCLPVASWILQLEFWRFDFSCSFLT